MFGITIGAFKIAGGVLIGLNALDMVQARRSQQRETPAETAEGIEKEDIGILPLGVPMLAGPGAISTVMVLALGSKSCGHHGRPLRRRSPSPRIVSYLTLAAGIDRGATSGTDGYADPHPA